MIKISLYKTTQDNLPKAFCALAEKCYHNGISAFVYTNNKETSALLDRVLWTYSKKQFIPHGTIYDPHPEKQPILLGDEIRNLNNSSSIIAIDADKDKIFAILSTLDQFDLSNFQRLILLVNQEKVFSKDQLEEIFIKSSLKEFKLEVYLQTSDGNWSQQK